MLGLIKTVIVAHRDRFNGLRKYEKQIEGDEEIAKSKQNRD